MISWDQLFHSGHLSLSSKVTWSEFQQQCSWLNQNPSVHMPSFKSVIQWAEISIKPAKEPDLRWGKGRPKLSEKTREKRAKYRTSHKLSGSPCNLFLTVCLLDFHLSPPINFACHQMPIQEGVKKKTHKTLSALNTMSVEFLHRGSLGEGEVIGWEQGVSGFAF